MVSLEIHKETISTVEEDMNGTKRLITLTVFCALKLIILGYLPYSGNSPGLISLARMFSTAFDILRMYITGHFRPSSL